MHATVSTMRLAILSSSFPTASSYICRQCRRKVSAATPRTSLLSSSPFLSHRQASNAPFLDKVRKKVWGTNLPPGPADPYGSPGVIDERQKLQKDAVERREQIDARTKGLQKGREESARVEQDEVEEIEATTWEGMPTVGGQDWGMDVWDEEFPYEGYMANTIPESKDKMICIVHQALAEVLTLKKEGLPLVLESHATSSVDDYTQRISEGARLETTADGQAQVVIEGDELRQLILDHIVPQPMEEEEEEEEVADDVEDLHEDNEGVELIEERLNATGVQEESQQAEPATILLDTETDDVAESLPYEEESTTDTSDETLKSMPVDDSWRTVALFDLDMKFAVLKRVMQLSGKRIPDPEIQEIHDSKSLLASLVKKPKPQKLVEILHTKDLADLPNVQISDRRLTYIDKEKEVGRWKVIERELEARGLPVTGSGLPARGEAVA